MKFKKDERPNWTSHINCRVTTPQQNAIYIEISTPPDSQIVTYNPEGPSMLECSQLTQ